MKKALKIFGILCLTALVFASCSKDDDPSDNDFFIGKYNGSISYTSGDESISKKDGYVEVVKAGDNYDFIFSNDIPAIKGVKIEKGKNKKIKLSFDGSYYINIDEDNLDINYGKDGAVWTADCKR